MLFPLFKIIFLGGIIEVGIDIHYSGLVEASYVPWLMTTALAALLGRAMVSNIENLSSVLLASFVFTVFETAGRISAPATRFLMWYVWTRGDAVVAFAKAEKFRTSTFRANLIVLNMMVETIAIVAVSILTPLGYWYFDIEFPGGVSNLVLSPLVQLLLEFMGDMVATFGEHTALQMRTLSMWKRSIINNSYRSTMLMLVPTAILYSTRLLLTIISNRA